MSAPTAKKPRAKKAPAKTVDHDLDAELVAMAPAAEEDQPIDLTPRTTPVQIGKRGRKGTEIEWVEVFELDGTTYRVPKEPSPAMVLQYMHNLRKVGRLGAIEGMAFGLLGEPAMDALSRSPETTEEDVADVFTYIGQIFFGSNTYKRLAATTGN